MIGGFFGVQFVVDTTYSLFHSSYVSLKFWYMFIARRDINMHMDFVQRAFIASVLHVQNSCILVSLLSGMFSLHFYTIWHVVVECV